jgi:hypothetical protein
MENKSPELGPRLVVVILLFAVFMGLQFWLMYRDMTSERNTTDVHQFGSAFKNPKKDLGQNK